MRRGAIADLWHRHPAILTAFVLALAVTLVFGIRFAVSALYWSDPAHRMQGPEPWMTPRYIARSWDRDAAEIAAAVGLGPETRGERPTLSEIARQRGVPVEVVLQEARSVLGLTAE